MVNAAFAEANGFVVGDVFHANINGQRRALTITGTALSPEFIYTIGPGALMPDNEGYGILWMTEAAVAAAFDMEGAFNHLALRISAEAVPEDVMDALDALLDPMAGSAPMTGPPRSATVSSPPRSTSCGHGHGRAADLLRHRGVSRGHGHQPDRGARPGGDRASEGAGIFRYGGLDPLPAARRADRGGGRGHRLEPRDDPRASHGLAIRAVLRFPLPDLPGARSGSTRCRG
jgi:hypothetical protein